MMIPPQSVLPLSPQSPVLSPHGEGVNGISSSESSSPGPLDITYSIRTFLPQVPRLPLVERSPRAGRPLEGEQSLQAERPPEAERPLQIHRSHESHSASIDTLMELWNDEQSISGWGNVSGVAPNFDRSRLSPPPMNYPNYPLYMDGSTLEIEQTLPFQVDEAPASGLSVPSFPTSNILSRMRQVIHGTTEVVDQLNQDCSQLRDRIEQEVDYLDFAILNGTQPVDVASALQPQIQNLFARYIALGNQLSGFLAASVSSPQSDPSSLAAADPASQLPYEG